MDKQVLVHGYWQGTSGLVAVQQSRGSGWKLRTFNSDGRFSCVEELELFAALVVILATEPGRSISVYFQRPTTVKTWRQLVLGEAVLPSGDKTVQRIRSRTRDSLASVVELDSPPTDWDGPVIEQRLQIEFDQFSGDQHSIISRAVRVLGTTSRERPQSGTRPQQGPEYCPCGKIGFKDKISAMLVISRADSRYQTGRAPRGAYKCPTSKVWHLTSKHGKIRPR